MRPRRHLVATSLGSIQCSGWGSDHIFGQGDEGRYRWPRFTVPAVTVAVDYATPAFRDERRRTQAENPPLGGGFQPMVGEPREIWMLDVEQLFPIHGRLTTLAEARAYVEAFGRTQIFK